MKHNLFIPLGLPDSAQFGQDVRRFQPVIDAIRLLAISVQATSLGIGKDAAAVNSLAAASPQPIAPFSLVHFTETPTGSVVYPADASLGRWANGFSELGTVDGRARFILQAAKITGSFVAGTAYYLGNSGQITSNPNTSNALQFVGIAVDNLNLIWNYHKPIL